MVDGGGGPGDPVARALEELRNKAVRQKIVQFARSRTRTHQDADDLAHEALIKVLDPAGSPWNPEEQPSFFLHVGSIINGMVRNGWRSGRARKEVVDTDLARQKDEKKVDGEPLPDEALGEHQELAWLRKLGQRLLDQLPAKDVRARQVFDAGCRGAEKPAEMAAAVGCDVKEVYPALRRLKQQAGKILEEERRTEARRKLEVRERPAPSKQAPAKSDPEVTP